eukprot:TRINITY_DN124490_c0_g1_i1.p7 TRINITY_DN124490_c0_g1~~TRINITY_DN124490_c0_g1_i1.p7  ORF type:complete len:139 (+),score=3.23 TRINITY_DN124490_c0_g1_i1:29-418(+)
MAITEEGILSYQIRKGNNNSHSFSSFIIDTIRHLLEKGVAYAENCVLLIDNARFHCGQIATSLYKILPVDVLYLAPYFLEANPIEKIFGILKENLRRTTCNSMYVHLQIKPAQQGICRKIQSSCRKDHA